MKRHLTKSNSGRCVWTKSDDKTLKVAVSIFEGSNWVLIANYVNTHVSSKTPSKSSKQCRERWVNHLNPDIDSEPISTKEANLIFNLHKKLGNQWSKIAENLPGRNDNYIKNWFVCRLRRIVRCVKKGDVKLELPKNWNEFKQILHLLDCLYKFYISPEKGKNMAEMVHSQIKKRKNDGDKYIHNMIEKLDVTIDKVDSYVKGIMKEIRFQVDKSLIHEYLYLLDLKVNQCSFNGETLNIEGKNGSIASTSRTIFFYNHSFDF